MRGLFIRWVNQSMHIHSFQSHYSNIQAMNIFQPFFVDTFWINTCSTFLFLTELRYIIINLSNFSVFYYLRVFCSVAVHWALSVTARYKLRKTRQCINDDRISIYRWAIPLILHKQPHLPKNVFYLRRNNIHPQVCAMPC